MQPGIAQVGAEEVSSAKTSPAHVGGDQQGPAQLRPVGPQSRPPVTTEPSCEYCFAG